MLSIPVVVIALDDGNVEYAQVFSGQFGLTQGERMQRWGADTGRLREQARAFDSASSEITSAATSASTAVDTVEWLGSDADDFRATWSATVGATLHELARVLAEHSAHLDTQAEQQESASAPGDAAGTPRSDSEDFTGTGGFRPLTQEDADRILEEHEKVPTTHLVTLDEALGTEFGGPFSRGLTVAEIEVLCQYTGFTLEQLQNNPLLVPIFADLVKPLLAAVVASVALAEQESNARYPDERHTDSKRDAFRHAYASAVLALLVGTEFASDFTTAHESLADENILDESGDRIPDTESVAEAMDVYNNGVGIDLSQQDGYLGVAELADVVQDAVESGQLVEVDLNTGGLKPTQ